MPQKIILILLVTLSAFTGCAQITTRKLTLTHFESGEILNGTIYLGPRKVVVTMPTGEVVEGKYVAASGGQGYALLKSSSSNLMIEVRVTFNEGGNGFGEAQANNGRSYKVRF